MKAEKAIVSALLLSDGKRLLLREKSEKTDMVKIPTPKKFFDLSYKYVVFCFLRRLGNSAPLVVVFIQVKSDRNQCKLQNYGFYAPSIRSFV